MRNFLALGLATTVFAALAVTGVSRAADDKDKPKYTIKEVMQAQKKLQPLIVQGKATDDDKKKMLEYYEALPKNKPPKGDEESWKKLTTALVAATKDVVEKKDGAVDEFKKASNCAACHKPHRPTAQ